MHAALERHGDLMVQARDDEVPGRRARCVVKEGVGGHAVRSCANGVELVGDVGALMHQQQVHAGHHRLGELACEIL
jgi:hypothetical protein